jgi:hypothetical protein
VLKFTFPVEPADNVIEFAAFAVEPTLIACVPVPFVVLAIFIVDPSVDVPIEPIFIPPVVPARMLTAVAVDVVLPIAMFLLYCVPTFTAGVPEVNVPLSITIFPETPAEALPEVMVVFVDVVPAAVVTVVPVTPCSVNEPAEVLHVAVAADVSVNAPEPCDRKVIFWLLTPCSVDAPVLPNVTVPAAPPIFKVVAAPNAFTVVAPVLNSA